MRVTVSPLQTGLAFAALVVNALVLLLYADGIGVGVMLALVGVAPLGAIAVRDDPRRFALHAGLAAGLYLVAALLYWLGGLIYLPTLLLMIAALLAPRRLADRPSATGAARRLAGLAAALVLALTAVWLIWGEIGPVA